MWVLLIEDDAATARSIELMLKSEIHDCDIKPLGEDGLIAAKLHNYDIILLDLMLPGMTGLEVLRRLRADQVGTPVLIISGLSGIVSEGLNSGADDYLVKPFDNRELLARMQAVLRRCKINPDTIIRTRNLSVNLNSQSVKIDNRPVHVTFKEYKILEILCQRHGIVVRKESLLNHLYDGMDEPDTKIIDVFICKLRKKLNMAGGEDYIETIWGQGYKLRKEQ